MSSAGCVELVELHGERFEVQTELADPARGKVRTTIFRSGRVVAVNETTLRSVAALVNDPESLREVVALHHRHVVDGFVGRTRSFVDRLSSTQPPLTTDPPELRPVVPAAAAEAEVEVPPFPEDPAVGDGLDLRRLFGEMRRRIETGGGDDSPPPGSAGVEDPRTRQLHVRLQRAGEAIAWATAQPRFSRARVDEQVRFHLLAERISGWQRHGCNCEEASWIWTEVVAFCDYVSEISLRTELVDFDRRLVLWALRALERHGATRATLQPLEWLFGRDRQLDDLLVDRPTVPAATWANHLRRMCRHIGGG